MHTVLKPNAAKPSFKRLLFLLFHSCQRPTVLKAILVIPRPYWSRAAAAAPFSPSPQHGALRHSTVYVMLHRDETLAENRVCYLPSRAGVTTAFHLKNVACDNRLNVILFSLCPTRVRLRLWACADSHSCACSRTFALSISTQDRSRYRWIHEVDYPLQLRLGWPGVREWYPVPLKYSMSTVWRHSLYMVWRFRGLLKMLVVAYIRVAFHAAGTGVFKIRHTISHLFSAMW